MMEKDFETVWEALRASWRMQNRDEINAARDALDRIEAKLNPRSVNVDEYYKD